MCKFPYNKDRRIMRGSECLSIVTNGTVGRSSRTFESWDGVSVTLKNFNKETFPSLASSCFLLSWPSRTPRGLVHDD